MKSQLLKRIFSSISATTIAATSFGLNTVFAVNATDAPNTGHVCDVGSLLFFDDHSECCEEHDHAFEEHEGDECCGHDHDCTGKGVTIALLDAGVTDHYTASKESFIDDNTIDSNHGNNMMSVLSQYAPEADVFDVRVLNDEGMGTYSAVEQGIRWSVDNEADIIVMSFVGEKQSALLEDALAYAEDHGVLVIASAGNNASTNAVYPAAYPTVLSVGAIDSDGNIQDYSNYGDFVDTYADSEVGTSNAAQVIAATAAVMMGEDDSLTAQDIREIYGTNKPADLTACSEDNADAVVYAAATCKNHKPAFKMTAKAATCETDGVAIYVCPNCNKSENRTIKAYGHNWGSWSTTAATCTTPIIKTRKCTRSGCTSKQTQSSGTPLGHNYTYRQTARAATCTTDGIEVWKCTRCNDTINKTVKAYGHHMSGYTATPATCTSPTIYTRHCTNSGCRYTDSYSSGSPLGHNFQFKQTAKAATCTTNGVGIYVCSRCQQSQERTINAYGHDHQWVTVQTVNCTRDGIRQYKCQRSGCGHVEKTETTKAYGHSWSSWTILTKPTTTTEGKKTRKCTRTGCNASETVTMPKLGQITVTDDNFKKFTYYPDGTLDQNCCSRTLYGSLSGKSYLKLKIKTNVDWTVSANTGFVHFKNTNGTAISSGKAGESYLLITLDSMPLSETRPSRTATITIKANDATKTYTIEQTNRSINGMTKQNYLNSVSKRIGGGTSQLPTDSRGAQLLRGDAINNGSIEYFSLDSTWYIAISTHYLDTHQSSVLVEYIIFEASKGCEGNSMNPTISVVENNGMGMKLKQGSAALFRCRAVTSFGGATQITDPERDRALALGQAVRLPLSVTGNLAIASSVANVPACYFLCVGYDKLLTAGTNMMVNLVAAQRVNNGFLGTTTDYYIENGCQLSKNNDMVRIHCSAARTMGFHDVDINFLIQNSLGQAIQFSK